MDDRELKERVIKEMDALGKALEERVAQNPELQDIKMPEDSCQDLKERIERMEAGKTGGSLFFAHKRVLLTVACAAIVLIGSGLLSSGSRLFRPEVRNQDRDGELNVSITTGDNEYIALDEEGTYEKIEKELGILALRLGYKPEGMEFVNAYVDSDMGEAYMEFLYQEQILSIYMNKQNSQAVFDFQPDGQPVEKITVFSTDQEIPIYEIDKGDGNTYFRTQIEYMNGYYYITGDMNLDEFEKILLEIIFKSV